MLSRLAGQHAAEIANHDWSDAPFRADRAGHDRASDNRQTDVLTDRAADTVRLNAMWVTAQVLAYNDPNFDVVEFAKACGVQETRPGILKAGLRGGSGTYARPGSWDYDEDRSTGDTAVATPGRVGSVASGSISRVRVTLDVDEKTTWGDLRRFVTLAHTEFDDQETLSIEWSENGEIVGLWTYVSI